VNVSSYYDRLRPFVYQDTDGPRRSGWLFGVHKSL